MIKLNFTEPSSKEWIEWKALCEKETQKVIKDFNRGTKPEFSNLYKQLKSKFLKIFNGKCAYCESNITASQPGDIDHFRPKSRITDSNNKLIFTIDEEGNEVEHPGYYWLVYFHNNLILSCSDCNRPNSGNSDGKRVGKWDQFPVLGDHAVKPGEEISEEPLLINPILEDPSDHLEMDNLGIIHPKSKRGEKCIEIFGLNLRQSLIEERKRVYDFVKDKTRADIIRGLFSENDEIEMGFINSYIKGKPPYSFAGRKAIADYKNENQQIREFLKTKN